MEENTNTPNTNKNSMYYPLIVGVTLLIVAILGIALLSTKKDKVAPAEVNPSPQAQNNLNETVTVPSPTQALSSPTIVTSILPSITPTARPSITVSASPTPTIAPTTSAVKEITVTASNYKFEPNIINVKQGESVKITVKNTEGTHDFALDEFNAQTQILNGTQSETIQFVADQKGSFEYYCSVGNHREMGMKGSLIVN